MNRREFMQTTVLGGAATAIGARVEGAAQSANDRIQVGFIGCGARAHQLMQEILDMPQAQIVGLCDAYTGRIARAKARTGGSATVYRDYKELLAAPGIDAVFIVTPDHWHKAMVLDALAAKKDVYIEKPLSFSVADGEAMVQAAARGDRIVQVGSQGVSSPEIAKARELIKAGRLGEVTMIRAAYNRNGDSGAWLYPIPPDASPQTVNWDQFLGPAPKRGFDAERFFRWRCYWDYSGGIATDLFVHLVSWYHHALDLKAPHTVLASGANYRYTKTHEVPDTLNALLQYDKLTASLMCTFNNELGTTNGLEILGTEGGLALRGGALIFTAETRAENNRWVVDSWAEEAARAYYADPKVQAVESPFLKPGSLRADGERWQSTGRDDTFTHIANFFDCVKTRKQPVEDAAFGHRAAACAHLVNQSVKEKRALAWTS